MVGGADWASCHLCAVAGVCLVQYQRKAKAGVEFGCGSGCAQLWPHIQSSSHELCREYPVLSLDCRSMSPIHTARISFIKPLLPAVCFLSGVTYDVITLNRIDRWQDNLILLFYLVLLGGLIVLTGRSRDDVASGPERLEAASPIVRLVVRTRSYYPMAIQFLLGSLFSAYAIFYSQSATLTGTAVFCILLVVLLVVNEFLRSRLSSLRLLVSLYALVCFAFVTFFLPVMTGYMNVVVFLIGAALSAGAIFCVVQWIYYDNPDRSRLDTAGVMAPAFGLIALLVGFYFLNWIPPVPLSLKYGGIYHEIKKTGDRYELSFERQWYQVWKRSDDLFPADESIYCFTAVFAPIDLNTTIYHHWYYRAANSKPFGHADRIPLKISGGREGGYRAYSFKQRLDPGDWRVDVETEDGRVIGRVSVKVEAQDRARPALTTVSY